MIPLERYFPLLSVLCALFSSLVFIPALSGDFVLDDGFNILTNRLLYIDVLSTGDLINAALSFHDGNGSRPLPMLSFALDYWRSGSMDPGAFKATNLLIHGLTIFFMTLFLRRLLLSAGWKEADAAIGALCLALIWAIHPMQVSSVMYVVQRMQTMETLFLVLALWAYLGMRQRQMDGVGRGRGQGLLVLVFWLLALGCKEDAPLLFAFLLALELTVLRFQAAEAKVSKGLRQSFLLLTALGAIAYLFVIIPYYWSWDTHISRDFSTLERLLTQPRVLIMYLGQILFPYPDHMPFIYDQLPVSRSVLQPWTTLPALALVIALMSWAWGWRVRRPLFSLGVLLFFFGHFITSNVIPLELAFEHRNHFPLIGVVIATGDLLVMVWNRWEVGIRLRSAGVAVIVLVLGVATASHAYTWGDPVRHGEKLASLLPDSSRAWTQLGGAHFDRYNQSKDEVHLQRAIEANQAGLYHVNSPALASNVVIYRSIQGTITDNDWQHLLTALQDAPHGWQNKSVVWTLLSNLERGFDLDEHWMAQVVEVLPSKAGLSDSEYLRLAIFMYKNSEPEQALPYFIEFAKKTPPESRTLNRIIGELAEAGHDHWVEQLRVIQAESAARSMQ